MLLLPYLVEDNNLNLVLVDLLQVGVPDQLLWPSVTKLQLLGLQTFHLPDGYKTTIKYNNKSNNSNTIALICFWLTIVFF